MTRPPRSLNPTETDAMNKTGIPRDPTVAEGRTREIEREIEILRARNRGHNIHDPAFADRAARIRALRAELASFTPAPPSAPAAAEVLADFIERHANEWKGANGGIYTIHAMSLDLACEIVTNFPSLAALAGAASFRDGVEAIEAARDRHVAAVDPDPHERTAWQSGAIEDGFRLSLAALRALTPPAASQDSGAEVTNGPQPDGSVVLGAIFRKDTSPETTDIRERAAKAVREEIRRQCREQNGFLAADDAGLICTDADLDPALIANVVLSSRTPDIAATGGASGHPFGFYRELSNGVGEFQKHGHAFSPTASGFKVWALYSADAINAERERAEKAEAEARRLTRIEEQRYIEACKKRCEWEAQVTRLTEDLAARTGERELWCNRAFEQQVQRDTATARADALQQRVEALEELLIRAQNNVPTYQVNWHADCRTVLSQTPTPNAKTEDV